MDFAAEVGTWGMPRIAQPYEEINEYFRHFNPRHRREEEVFRKLGYIDIQNLSHRIKTQVRMYTALWDDKCPIATQFASYNKIPGNRKQALLYPEFEREMLAGYQDEMLQYMLEDVEECIPGRLLQSGVRGYIFVRA